MLSKLLSFFRRKPLRDEFDLTNVTLPEDISETLPRFDLGDMEDPELLGNINSEKTLLIMDDQEEVFVLYWIDFKNILRNYGIDIHSEYKIVKCSGPDAGFMAHKYLANTDDKLVVAILDLTLGKIVKLDDGSVVLFDGVDIAVEILDTCPECRIRFCTGHMPPSEDGVGIIGEYGNKLRKKTGLEMRDVYFSKNSDRAKAIVDALGDV